MDYGKNSPTKGNAREPRRIHDAPKGIPPQAQSANAKKAMLERMKAAAEARKK